MTCSKFGRQCVPRPECVVTTPTPKAIRYVGLKGKVVHAIQGGSVGLIEQSLERVAELEDMVHDLTSSLLFSRWMATPNVLGTRKEAGYWLNWLGLAGDGVEVGVFRGEFSRVLLRTWRCASLLSVDPWREFPQTEYVDACNMSQSEHDANYRDTVERLRPFGKRSRILKATSMEAAANIASASLAFVYLDAQHHYEAVRDDIDLWHSKVKPGGVLGGHDYLDGVLDSGRYGVKKAVDEFAAANGYAVVLTQERDWPSWFVRIA